MHYSSQEASSAQLLQPMGMIYHLSTPSTATAAAPSPAIKKGNVFDMFDLRPELLPPSNKQAFSSQRPLVYRGSSNAYTSAPPPSSVPRPVKSTDLKYPRGKFMSPSDVR